MCIRDRFVWGSFFGDIIYEMVPGVILATLAMVLVSLATRPKDGVEEEFDEAIAATDYALDHPEVSFPDALEAVKGNRTGSAAV